LCGAFVVSLVLIGQSWLPIIGYIRIFWLPADFALTLPALRIDGGRFYERAKKCPGLLAMPGLFMRTE
jgi:hypothetical protein